MAVLQCGEYKMIPPLHEKIFKNNLSHNKHCCKYYLLQLQMINIYIWCQKFCLQNRAALSMMKWLFGGIFPLSILSNSAPPLIFCMSRHHRQFWMLNRPKKTFSIIYFIYKWRHDEHWGLSNKPSHMLSQNQRYYY